MAEPEIMNSEEVEWTVVESEDVNGEEIETQDGPVFVAMQPGVDIPAGVEVHEVVIVTEGSESVQEIGQQQELPPRQELSTLLRDDSLLKRPREAPKIRIKKRPLGQYVADNSFETPISSKTVSRGRPKGSKNITYKQPIPRPRTPMRPSLPSSIHVKQESQTSSDESDSDSDDDDDMDGPGRKRPKPRDFAHRLQWRNKDMLDAMKTVQEKKYTIRGAAKKFSVPYSTLKDRVHGRVRHGTKPGVKTVLSPEEEEELVRYVKDMEASGFQMKCMDVRDRAAEMLRLNHGHNSPYKEGSPGHNWLAGFLKRHPGLEFKRSVNRNIIPSLTKQKQMVRRFFEIASNVYKKHKMSHRADRIFSVSELQLHGMLEATILYAASSDGMLIPPFVIFRGRALKLTSARQAYPSAFFTCCYDGNVNEDSFLWWYRDHFMKHAASNTRPTVLYIGRSIQDITLQLVQNAKEERVHLISLPRGVQHLLQPLDNEINDNIRSMIVKRMSKCQEGNPGQACSHKIVALILQKVWKKLNPNDIVSKFAKNGLYPLNSYAISNERIVSASHLLRESYSRETPEPGSSPLAGLNLLSALSSHEYASIEQLYSGNGAGAAAAGANQSFEQESDTSGNNGDHHNHHHQQQPPQRIPRTASGRRTLEHGIELEEAPVEESVVMEHDIIEEPVAIGEEIVEGNSAEEVKHILAHQQELLRKSRNKPRPNTDLLQRNTNVQREISAAKNNPEQINRAIHSILEMERSQEQQQGDEDDIDDDGATETLTIKQEPLSSSQMTSHRTTPTELETAAPVKSTMKTLCLVGGKLVDETGREVDLTSINAGKMHIEIKLNKNDTNDNDNEELMEVETESQDVYQRDLYQEDQEAGDGDHHYVEQEDIPQFVQPGTTVEELNSMSREQINELLSSGAIQSVGVDSSGVIQTENGNQFVQVYGGSGGELPQQILQSEEVPQTIMIDQAQLQQMLMEGGQVLTAEEEYEEDGSAVVEYIQMADGTLHEVSMQ